MNKEAEGVLEAVAAELAKAKKAKAEAEEIIKNSEKALKDQFEADGISEFKFGNGYTVKIEKVASSLMVDTAKLKAAGLFDQYSKQKAGSTQVRISNPDDEFLVGLNERRQKHIEESKKAKDGAPF